MQLRFLSVLLLIYCTWINAHAESISIENCVALAESNYPQVAQLGLIDATRDFNISNAAKAWLPQAQVYAQATWQNDVMEFPQALTYMLQSQNVEYKGINKFQYKAGVSINQSVWDGGSISASKSRLRTEAEVEKKDIELDIYDVASRVEEIYFSILIIDQEIQQINSTSVLLDSIMNSVNLRIRNGVAMETDRYETEAKIVETDRRITQLNILKKMYVNVLSLYVGSNLDNVTLEIPSEIELPKGVKPTDALMQAQLDNLSAQEKVVSASLMPKFGAFVNTFYGYPGFNTFKGMTSSNPNFNFLIGLNINWNIGELYTRKNRLQLIATQRNRIQATKNTLDFNRDLQSLKISGDVESLKSSLDSDKRLAALRREIRIAAQTQYANGVTDATTLLSKVTDEESSRIAMKIDELKVMQAIYKLNRNDNR